MTGAGGHTEIRGLQHLQVSDRSILCPACLGQWLYPMTHFIELYSVVEKEAGCWWDGDCKTSGMTTSSKCRCSSCGQCIDKGAKEREPRVSFQSLVQQPCARHRAYEPWQWYFQMCWWARKRTMGMYQGRYDFLSTWRAVVCSRHRLYHVAWPMRQGSLDLKLQVKFEQKVGLGIIIN